MALDAAPGGAPESAPFVTSPAPPTPAAPAPPEQLGGVTPPAEEAVSPGAASEGMAQPPGQYAQGPPPQPLVQEFETLRQNVAYVQWLEGALQQQAATDQQAYLAARQYAPMDAHGQLEAEYRQKEAERQAAYAEIKTAKQQAQLAEEAIKVKYARHLMEGPARQVVTHNALQKAVDALPGLPPRQVQQELGEFLAGYDHPPSLERATDQYIKMRRGSVSAERAASGIDQMGGTTSNSSSRRTSSHEDFIAAIRGGH